MQALLMTSMRAVLDSVAQVEHCREGLLRDLSEATMAAVGDLMHHMQAVFLTRTIVHT